MGKAAQNFIAKFLYPPQPPRTIQKIREAVKNELGEIYSAHILRKYVKKWLRYSFKKAWSRPPKYAASATKMSKGWFSAELLKMVHKKQLIFRVDEWSFTRAVKAEYSWLPVGKSSSAINDVQKSSSSLIFSIGSNGQWFGLIKQGTIDSKIFWIFLNLLDKALFVSNRTCQNASFIILDNARIHTSTFSKIVISHLKLRVKYLPPYCPELAPVEHVFRAIKAKLRSRSSIQTTDFNKQPGIETQKEAIDSFSKKTWMNVWVKVIHECFETIKATLKEIEQHNKRIK